MSTINKQNTEPDVTPEETEETRDILPVGPPAKWDYETDILIVGGGAGLCAAAAALKNGARVLVLEKQAETGGHSQHAGAAATFNTAAAKRRGLSTNRAKAFKYSYTVQSNATIDSRLLATLIDRAHEVYDWSESQSWGKQWDAFKIGFVPVQGVARMIVKGTFKNSIFTSGTEFVAPMYPWMQWLEKHVTEKGGKILVNTKALSLMKESDKIVGVKAQATDGKTVFAKANRAVILAGSGFTNNREMIKKYCPDIYNKAVGTFLPPTDTGEVVRMALGAGADLAGKNSWVAFAGGIPFFDTKYTGKSKPGPWFQYLRQGWLQLARGGGWLEVNAACEEYIPITARLDWEMHPRATASLSGSVAYVIFDADYPTTLYAIH
jgi:succinate dehydrogenase/fumarate reductase flavoprotein subunit